MSQQTEKKKTSLGVKIFVVLIFLVVLVILFQSGGDETNTSPPSSTSQPQVEEVSEAFKLASLEIGHNNPNDEQVAVFQTILNELKAKCVNETEEQIANYIFKTKTMIEDAGTNMTLVEAGNGINGSIPDDNNGAVSCAEIAAAFVVLVKGQ